MLEPCANRFTAAEGGARLANTAATQNTLVTECAGFISTRLLHEQAHCIRGSLSSGCQRSVRICRAINVKPDAYELRILTDLQVAEATEYDVVDDWSEELEAKEVLVCTSKVLRRILEEEILTMPQINVLIIDSCHLIYKDEDLQYIMKIYKQHDDTKRPRILALTHPLFSSKPKEIIEKPDNMQICEKNTIIEEEISPKAIEEVKTVEDEVVLVENENIDDFEMYEKLEWRIDQMEKELCCKMDLAEDIDGCKRIAGAVTKPKEVIIEYADSLQELVDDYTELVNYMKQCVAEVMEFLDDHRHDPTEIYGEELYEEFKNIPDPTVEPKHVFNEFLYILDELGPYSADKAAFTLLVKLEKSKIRVPYERHFLLLRLCTTTLVKIRCHTESIFEKYPNDWDKIRLFSTPKVMRFIEILEQFTPTEQKDAENVKSKEMMKDIDSCDFVTLGNKIEDKINTIEANLKDLGLDNIGKGENDLTRCKPSLSYLRSQYCAVEPFLEQKDSLKQGKRHEEVLKKFRMHECNLLLTTSALEEGIDLPRCNLVLRWDVPSSYRSYGLCRSRGRATRATAAILCCSPYTDTTLYNMAVYTELDQIITRKCGCGIQDEPSQEEEAYADKFTSLIKPYTPNETKNSSRFNKTQENSDNVGKSIETNEHSEEINEHSRETNEHSPSVERNEHSPSEESNEHSPNESEIIEQKLSGFETNEHSEEINEHSPSVERNKHSPNKEKNEHSLSESEIIENKLSGLEINEHKTIAHEVNEQKSIKNETNKLKRDCEINKHKYETNEHKSSVIELNEHKSSAIELNEHQYEINEHKAINKSASNTQNDSIVNNVNKSTDLDSLSEHLSDIRVSSENVSIKDTKDSCDSQLVDSEVAASVDLSTAIALINRYCAKLPSDTFTRLAPQWWMEKVKLPNSTRDSYICTLKLPLNCPLKYNIVGHPMPTRVLARRMVALQTCRILHKSGELDDQLMPIGKENFKASELEPSNNYNITNNDKDDDSARPGTTKRRQYYYKRTASTFTDCQPIVDTSDTEIDSQHTNDTGDTEKTNKNNGNKRNMLYAIQSSLWCALPERYNTRGRRLHAPQNAAQALAILMARDECTDLQIPSFPVYTRSGEVRVSVELVPGADVRLTPSRARLVRRFMRFVFTDVLRVRRRGMKLQSEGGTSNNYYIVPTVKSINEDGTSKIDIDWAFLELIYHHTEDKKVSDVEKPLPWVQGEDTGCDKSEVKGGCLENPLLKKGETFVFDVEKYKEAVVTPWYRNQDQPQFFLVAEICWNLTPESAFPSEAHQSFRTYYRAKYNVTLTQGDQPLLDVDHTSARLNLLTPRYVNRKGVALPVSSERTRRAKRDRLDQKQILVPELCRVHPFAAPLWFATVALPCVLYRINALLIADEIRRSVAIEVGLGIPRIDEKTMPGFQWPPLDFGWSLSEVLSADAEKTEKKKEEDREKEKDREIREIEEKKILEEECIKEEETPEKTINDILQEKEDAESGFEIGTWSNDMASSIPDSQFDDFMEPLPPNLTFCTSASGGLNWSDSIPKREKYASSRVYSVADSDCSYISSDFDTDDSDLEQDGSDEDTDVSGFCSSRTSNNAVGVRIEYKTAHEAEAVDVERKRKINPAPQRDVHTDRLDVVELLELFKDGEPDVQYVEKFRQSVETHKKKIIENNNLVTKTSPITELLPESQETKDNTKTLSPIDNKLKELFPEKEKIEIVDGQITLESIEKNKRVLLKEFKNSLTNDEIKKLNCFSMIDVDIDSPGYVNEKVANVGFDSREKYEEKILNSGTREFKPYFSENRGQSGKEYDFDYQPDLEGHPGPSPSVILQALTMSNANDGINLERLETIGDSFLKFAITAYLYCAHPTVHEGKLSHMRSKQVSNLNLYRLGKAKRLGCRMIASKFEPHDNWLPPCHRPPPSPHTHYTTETEGKSYEPQETPTGCYIPYNLITQHSIPDKSIADCVEALIGAYLLECGPRGALLFMSWLGINVLPQHKLLQQHVARTYCTRRQKQPQTPPRRRRTSSSSSSVEGSEPSQAEEQWDEPERVGPVGARHPFRDEHGNWVQIVYGELKAPPSPLLRYIEDPEGELEQMLSGYDALERTLQYRFQDRSLLLQALTHASHHTNRLTDCYQRLEFLGDAILDYLITRHLYEDARRHCPGALTDLRSALVNNTIFATLAVRHGFHKYFRHMSPGLNEVLTKYVKIQEENGHSISEEHYLIQEDELEQAEDVEVPKALGDLFESVAGAIFLDSGMSLGAVWQSYVRLMGAELEAFSAAAPKSPVRELLEAEPDTAKFGKPERLADGRRVRVCVEVFGRGTFKGIGRNYRIAKGTAARCALRHLKAHR